MKKLSFICLFLIFCFAESIAQSNIKVIVYSKTGKVKYAAPGSTKFKNLNAGAELDLKGTLKILPGASLALYQDEEYAIFKEAGEKSVESLASNINAFQEGDATEIFGEYLENAIHPYFGIVKVQNMGFSTSGDSGTPPPPKKGRDGAGNKNFKIIRLQPTGGKIADNTILFRWKLSEKDKKVKLFKFVLSSSSDEVLFEKEIDGNSYHFTSSDFQLSPGQSYKWKVSVADDSGKSTPNVSFDFVSASDQADVLKELSGEEMYQKADLTTRIMLEATALEEAEFLYKAMENYTIAKNLSKKNKLAQKMYKAFLWRYDMVE